MYLHSTLDTSSPTNQQYNGSLINKLNKPLYDHGTTRKIKIEKFYLYYCTSA